MIAEVDLSPSKRRILKMLRKVTGIEDESEVVREALMLMAWAAIEVAQGREVASLKDGETRARIIEMPALNAARASSPPKHSKE
jgi:hypothetical protein